MRPEVHRRLPHPGPQMCVCDIFGSPAPNMFPCHFCVLGSHFMRVHVLYGTRKTNPPAASSKRFHNVFRVRGHFEHNKMKPPPPATEANVSGAWLGNVSASVREYMKAARMRPLLWLLLGRRALMAGGPRALMAVPAALFRRCRRLGSALSWSEFCRNFFAGGGCSIFGRNFLALI